MLTHAPVLDEFPVDLWFCYGSFFYGIECLLSSCTQGEVVLFLPHGEADEAQGLSHFLEMILDKPKGLLRVELRVYLPEKLAKKTQIASPIYLFTDIVPSNLEKIGASLALLFSSVQGISPAHSENWTKLVRQILQTHKPHFFKKP